jgi:hypothetical protein
MNHPAEEELIAYRDGQASRPDAINSHLADCPECRREFERLEEVLSAISSVTVPDPGEDYGARVWQRIQARLPEKGKRWRGLLTGQQDILWLLPRRWALAGVLALLLLAAFLAGRITKHSANVPVASDPGTLRERVLLVAVGEHLDRSEMVLVELAHAEPQSPGEKRVDISAEQQRAEDLLEENRLYRQTALEQGDTALASVLDELERVLADVAHSPEDVTTRQLETIRQRMEAQGILFKIRVVGKELRHREQTGNASPVQNDAKSRERNRT